MARLPVAVPATVPATPGRGARAPRAVPLHPDRRRPGRVHSPGSRPARQEPAHQTSVALRDLCRAVSDAETALARNLGLRAGDYRAIKVVLYASPPVGVSGLAARVGLSKGTTSELVDRLEARGLLSRERDRGDGRRVVLRASPLARSQVHDDLGDLFGALVDVARDRDAATLNAISDFLRDAVLAVSRTSGPDETDASSGAVSA